MFGKFNNYNLYICINSKKENRINYFGNIISKFMILNKVFLNSVNISIDIYKNIYIELQYFQQIIL